LEIHFVTDSFPAFASIQTFSKLSGMSRGKIYVELANGNLKAVKHGDRTLIDVAKGLEFIAKLPRAEFGARRGMKPCGRRTGRTADAVA
jgi:hypothetical protein